MLPKESRGRRLPRTGSKRTAWFVFDAGMGQSLQQLHRRQRTSRFHRTPRGLPKLIPRARSESARNLSLKRRTCLESTSVPGSTQPQVNPLSSVADVTTAETPLDVRAVYKGDTSSARKLSTSCQGDCPSSSSSASASATLSSHVSACTCTETSHSPEATRM